MSLVVGIGELLWDLYPDGRKVAGGAVFNFTYHCHNLGHRAVMVSAGGDDDLGRELRERVRELGLTDEFLQADPRHPTGIVRVTVDTAGQPSYDHDLAKKLVALGAHCFGASPKQLVDIVERIMKNQPYDHLAQNAK